MNVEKLGITGGQWEVTGAYNHFIFSDDRIVIADCATNLPERYIPENTRVMAASPSMLKALIEEWKFIESYLASNAPRTDGFWYNEFRNRQNTIVSIIEKATGKSWEEIKELLDE